MYNKTLIGIVGKAQSGKDTVCDYISKRTYTRRVANADFMKEILAAFSGIPVSHFHEQGPDKERLRPLMQYFGTEVIRDMHDKFPDIWPKSAHTHHMCRSIQENLKHDTLYIVPDIRFADEIEVLRGLEAEGWVVQIWGIKRDNKKRGRPSKQDTASHASETAQDVLFTNGSLDVILDNSKDFDYLYTQVTNALVQLENLTQERHNISREDTPVLVSKRLRDIESPLPESEPMQERKNRPTAEELFPTSVLPNRRAVRANELEVHLKANRGGVVTGNCHPAYKPLADDVQPSAPVDIVSGRYLSGKE